MIQTLVLCGHSVPSVAVLRRFDCNIGTCIIHTPVLHIECGHSIPLMAVLRRFDCNIDTCIMWRLSLWWMY